MKSGAKLSTDNHPPKNQTGGSNAIAGANYSNAGISGKDRVYKANSSLLTPYARFNC